MIADVEVVLQQYSLVRLKGRIGCWSNVKTIMLRASLQQEPLRFESRVLQALCEVDDKVGCSSNRQQPITQTRRKQEATVKRNGNDALFSFANASASDHIPSTAPFCFVVANEKKKT